MQFSEWVKKHKLSVSALSRQTGIARQTVKSAISRNCDITLRTAMAIVKLTDGEVSIEELTRAD